MPAPDAIDDPFNMEAIMKLAAKAADKASHPTIAETDLGIHKTLEDRQCDELLAAGWKSCSMHPRSPIWLNPIDGLKYPGRGAAWELMHKQQSQQVL